MPSNESYPHVGEGRRPLRTKDCPYCNGNGHAGGRLDDPNQCGFCH